MAQAFINYMISNGDQQLQNQISQLRNKNQVDYSDCDENLLLQVADQMEQTYNESTRKRKLKPYELKEKNLSLELVSLVIFVIETMKVKNS